MTDLHHHVVHRRGHGSGTDIVGVPTRPSHADSVTVRIAEKYSHERVRPPGICHGARPIAECYDARQCPEVLAHCHERPFAEPLADSCNDEKCADMENARWNCEEIGVEL